MYEYMYLCYLMCIAFYNRYNIKKKNCVHSFLYPNVYLGLLLYKFIYLCFNLLLGLHKIIN